MTKIQEVQADMIAAMKAGRAEDKMSLSLLLSALKGKAKDKQADLTPEEEDAIILREIKQTKETLETAPSDRTEIIEQSKNRLHIYEKYAPKFMDEGEIRAVIAEVLAELGLDAPTPQQKGAIMKGLMPRVKGHADGALVNKLVSEVIGG